MRRVYAISLLATIALSLMAPWAQGQAESNLPACCRRNGAHRCALQADGQETSGIVLRAAWRVCSSFPTAMAPWASSDAALAKPEAKFLPGTWQRSRPVFPNQTPDRVFDSRSHQKRGPPLLA